MGQSMGAPLSIEDNANRNHNCATQTDGILCIKVAYLTNISKKITIRINMPQKITIIRHGETDYNKDDILQGQLNIPLNKLGVEQAKKVAKKLEGIVFDVFFSSDLPRTVQTAQAIKKVIKKEIIEINNLRERGLGKLEGLHKDEAFKLLGIKKGTFPLHHFWDFDEKKRDTHLLLETKKDLYRRVNQFIQKLKKDYAGKNVLLVSHGGTMRVLLHRLGFTDIDYLKKIPIINTSIIKLVKNGRKYDIHIDDEHVSK